MTSDKDISEVVACVVDDGMFMPVAVKMAESAKKVYYQKPTDDGWPVLAQCVIGDGHSTFTCIPDFWQADIFEEIDLFIFPNLIGDNLQGHLVDCGKLVWGGRRAARIERFKGLFYRTLEKIGLPVPKHVVLDGFSALEDHLRDHDDLFIKIDKYRDTMDTWHHRNYAQSSPYLDWLRWKLGSFKELIRFYAVSKIETNIEGGIDTYCIDGRWPNKAVLGYEEKNKTYLAAAMDWNRLPEVYTKINDAMGPVLAEYGYRQFFSTEIRPPYFIDPTCRCPSPAGEEQLEVYANMAEIIWKGAQGELVQPVLAAEYCGEALIEYTDDAQVEKSIAVPEEIERWVKLYGCAHVDGRYVWPPAEKAEIIGAAVAIGDTPAEVVEQLKEIKEALKDEHVVIDLSSFAHLIDEIEEAKSKGIPFSTEPLPEPAIVLESP